MQVKCKNCQFVTDLTEFNVSVGHVFDCADCAEPLRAIQIGENLMGIPIAEVPRPKMPDPDGRKPRQQRQEKDHNGRARQE